MTTNYIGSDEFTQSLDLMTDADSPSAQLFRVPNERLLDNDVHLRNRIAELEASSSLTSLTALSGTSAVTLAQLTIPADQAVAGTTYRYAVEVRAERGSTATGVDVTLNVHIAGSPVLEVFSALNTSNGFLGGGRLEGEITFGAAPGPSAAVAVTGKQFNRLTSPETVDLAQSYLGTAATNAALVIAVKAQMSAVVVGVSITPVVANISRIKA